MDKKLHRMDITEELDYYSNKIVNQVNAKITNYQHSENSTAKKIRFILQGLKHTDQSEIYDFLLNKMILELTKSHIEEEEKRWEEFDREVEDNKDTNNVESHINEPMINSNGYTNKLFIEALNRTKIDYLKTRMQQIKMNKEGDKTLIPFGYNNHLPQYTSSTKQNQNNNKNMIQASRTIKLLQDNPLERIIGSPQNLANEMVQNKQLDWPTLPWHGGKIKQNKKMQFRKKTITVIAQTALNAVPYLHVLLGMFAAINMLFMITDFFNALDYLKDEKQFFIYYFRNYSNFDVMIIYFWFSFLYPITKSLYNWKEFHFYVDDTIRFMKFVYLSRKSYLISFTFYVFYLVVGSVFTYTGSLSAIDDYYYDISSNSQNTLNGYTLDTLVRMYFIFVFLIYYFSWKNFDINNKQNNDLEITRNDRIKHKIVMGIGMIFIYISTTHLGNAVSFLQVAKNNEVWITTDFISPIYIVLVISILYFLILLFILRKTQIKTKFDWYNDLRELCLIPMATYTIDVIIFLVANVRGKNKQMDYYTSSYILSNTGLMINIFILLAITVLFYMFSNEIYQKIMNENIDDRFSAYKQYLKLKKIVEKIVITIQEFVPKIREKIDSF